MPTPESKENRPHHIKQGSKHTFKGRFWQPSTVSGKIGIGYTEGRPRGALTGAPRMRVYSCQWHPPPFLFREDAECFYLGYADRTYLSSDICFQSLLATN